MIYKSPTAAMDAYKAEQAVFDSTKSVIDGTGNGVGSVYKQSIQIIQNRYPNEIQQG